MTALEAILAQYRSLSQTEREKGNYFEELIRTWFRYETSDADLYDAAWLFADWAKEIGTPQFGISAKDASIDLVARTHGTGELHAIRCKRYAADHRVMKPEIDSFFTASGKKCFAQRIIVATTNDWSKNAEDALIGQNPQVYRSRYADNLGKELPCIPALKRVADFQAFAKADRDLAHWDLNYETVAPCPNVVLDLGKTRHHSVKALASLPDEHFLVIKMKFAKKRDTETNKSVPDKTTVIYNDHITVRNIPLDAYSYVVNDKPAIESVMERQCVSTGKDSGIVNDANLWATETMGDPAYPLELLLQVITVSLEAMKIVNAFPKLDIA